MISFDPVLSWPQWWILSSLSLLFFTVFSLRNARRLGLPKAITLTALRSLGIAILLLLLLRPVRQEKLPEQKRDLVVLAGIDTSASMQQADINNARRIDVATVLIGESGLDDPSLHLRLTSFDEEARTTTLAQLNTLRAEGDNTRIHNAVAEMLQGVDKAQNVAALLLFSDGHDFEMTSATKTALVARARNVPIYTIPLGSAGTVRDVNVRIANSQPFCYLKQKARITAIARFTGCENEFFSVQLLRDGKLVDSKEVSTRQEAELPIEFTVSETKAGQFEYEVRALPLYKETETGNNSAITYLNVLDGKLRVLLLEGEPNWDTTFLQRSLMRNDKIDLDAVIQYAPGKLRRLRKTPGPNGQNELKLPATRDEFNSYDIVLLGSKMGDLLEESQQSALIDAVREGGGVVVCLHGQTGLNPTAAAILEPAVWEETAPLSAELKVQREGRAIAPLQLLNNFRSGQHTLPPLTSVLRVKERPALAATMAQDTTGQADLFIHRPIGRGQSLALAAHDWWHWAFQSAEAAREGLFDRFWDQIIVWLLAGSDRTSGSQNRLRASTANLPLGEEIILRLQYKNGTQPGAVPVLKVTSADEAPASVTMTATANPLQFEARYVPAKTGRFRAEVQLPDQSSESARFLVFKENRESTEVSADRTYLKKLAEGSGGRMVEAADLPALVKTLKDSLQPEGARYQLISLWDRIWILYLIIAMLALDWYLRRRWGLT